MIELKVIVSMILQRFQLELAPGQTIKADPVTRLPRYGLYVRIRSRPDYDPNKPPAGETDDVSTATLASYCLSLNPVPGSACRSPPLTSPLA